MKFPFSTKPQWLCLVALIVLLLGSAVVFVYFTKFEAENQTKIFHGNAVVSNGEECAEIGMTILKEHNGTAVDAMIAVLFCEGVTVSQSMGIGGGFLATIYNKESGKVETLISRERAPLASHERMFDNMTAVEGILSVAVPGELKGYSEMHKRYGFVPWKTLIQPTINLCRSGHLVTKYLAKVLSTYADDIYKSESLSEVFVNPETNSVWVYGDRIKRDKLAETLELIAEEGAETMYTKDGKLAKMLVGEIQSLGGIITIDDFVQYKTEWSEPISTKLRQNQTMYSVQTPASGMVLALILNIMNEIEPKYSAGYFHQLIESFKFGYAKRTVLGDIKLNSSFISEFTNPDYVKSVRNKIFGNRTFNNPSYYGARYAMVEDHGTAQVAVLAANGDAVSVTSTINKIFGSKIRSRTTGIILNDEMDDFSCPDKYNSFGLPPSPANFIKPGKRPMSSMCPVIVLDENKDAILLTGSAGGSKITTSVAYVFSRHMWLKESLRQAIHAKRIHHQLLPMQIFYEPEFDPQMLNELESLGHKVEENKSLIGFTAITAISRARGFIEAEFDPRRHGSVEVFK